LQHLHFLVHIVGYSIKA
jgi:hypothetical protein